MHEVYVTEPVYRSGATFVWETPFDEVKEFCAANMTSEAMAEQDWDDLRDCAGFVIQGKLKDGKDGYLVYVADGERSFGTLVHEITHLIFAIFKDRGIDPDVGGTNEAYAYLYEYYFTESIKAMKLELYPAPKPKKRKKK